MEQFMKQLTVFAVLVSALSLANAQYNRQRRSGPNFSNIERDRWNALSDLKEYAALLPDDQDVQDILSKALSQTTPDPFAPQTFPPLETMPTIDFDDWDSSDEDREWVNNWNRQNSVGGQSTSFRSTYYPELTTDDHTTYGYDAEDYDPYSSDDHRGDITTGGIIAIVVVAVLIKLSCIGLCIWRVSVRRRYRRTLYHAAPSVITVSTVHTTATPPPYSRFQ